MGVGAEKSMPDEGSANPSTVDGRRGEINQRIQGLEGESLRTRNMGEIAHGVISNSKKYSHLMQVRIEHTQGIGQIIHEPSGYPEDKQ